MASIPTRLEQMKFEESDANEEMADSFMYSEMELEKSYVDEKLVDINFFNGRNIPNYKVQLYFTNHLQRFC